MKLVAFPFHDWRKFQAGGFRTRDAHLLQEFGRDPRVESILVVNRPVSRAERLVRGVEPFVEGNVREQVRYGARVARLTDVGSRTTVLDIADPSLFGPVAKRRGWWFDVFGDPGTLRCFRWALERTESVDAVWIAWLPTVAAAVLEFHPRRLVFDSLDNWLIHPALRSQTSRAKAAYAAILPDAAATFVSGPASGKLLSAWAPHVRLLPNGADPRFFAGSFERPADLPDPPVVGYAGSLAQRIDAELVADVATRLPDVAFVFVGPVLERRSLRPMLGLPNVRLLGGRRYDQVPAYLAHFDVAWIPHRVGEGETGGDPIKMYEYWAAGRQVVTTAIDGVGAHAAMLHIVRGAEETSGVIRSLLDGTGSRTATEVPSNRTWPWIAGQILDVAAG